MISPIRQPATATKISSASPKNRLMFSLLFSQSLNTFSNFLNIFLAHPCGLKTDRFAFGNQQKVAFATQLFGSAIADAGGVA